MKASYPDNGDVLGGAYRLETVLSEGRSSRVYRAVQEAMQRQVAIKVLAPEVCRDLVARMRFEQEARICVELRHPNLVELVDIGLTNGGLPFYVMELLSGRALSELRPGDLSEARIGEVARELLNGLAAVHDAGIVHRNIKPSNIILCDYVGGEEAVKLIGFGGAKVVEPSKNSELATFETGALGGEQVSEPRYMSPEQLRGKVPTPASDLYSVGLVLAELLSGEPS